MMIPKRRVRVLDMAKRKKKWLEDWYRGDLASIAWQKEYIKEMIWEGIHSFLVKDGYRVNKDKKGIAYDIRVNVQSCSGLKVLPSGKAILTQLAFPVTAENWVILLFPLYFVIDRLRRTFSSIYSHISHHCQEYLELKTSRNTWWVDGWKTDFMSLACLQLVSWSEAGYIEYHANREFRVRYHRVCSVMFL